MPKQLVIMPNWIGDAVLVLSVLRQKPSSDITLLAAPHLVPLCMLLSDYPVIPYNRISIHAFREMLAAVHKGNFSVIYVIPTSFSSAWLAWRSKIPRRRGIAREMRELFFNETLPRSLHSSSRHILHEYSEVLEIPYNPPERWEGYTLKSTRNYHDAIVLCPGSHYGPTKRWPWYGELAHLLPDARIVLLGDKADEESIRSITEAASGRIENLIGKTTLVEAAQVIAGARLVIANDSGLMHLAGYAGTPVVGIFGSTSPIWTRPLGKHVRIVQPGSTIDCSPCFEKQCKHAHYNCLTAITSQSVANCAMELLAEIVN